MRRQFILIELPQPRARNINEELQWLGNSLGLFSERDRDKSCFRVFITLVKQKNSPLTSDQIANQLSLSRGTVIHHINRLMSSGIVLHERGGYVLRVETLEQLIDEIHKDTERMFLHIRKISKDIDGWLNT